MEFFIICIIALAFLGIAAAVASHYDKGSDDIIVNGGCDECTGRDDCKLAELKKQCGKRQ